MSLQNVCRIMVWEIVQIYGVQIIGKCICEVKKLNIDISIHAPGKTIPRFLSSLLRETKITYSPSSKQRFFVNLFPSQQKRGTGDYIDYKDYNSLEVRIFYAVLNVLMMKVNVSVNFR